MAPEQNARDVTTIDSWMSEQLLLPVDQEVSTLPPARDQAFRAQLVKDLIHNICWPLSPSLLTLPPDFNTYGVSPRFWEAHKISWKMCQQGSSRRFKAVTIPFIQKLNPGLAIQGKNIKHILSSPCLDRITCGISANVERKRDHIQQILQVFKKTLEREEPGGELILAGGGCVFLMGLTAEVGDIDIYASKMSHSTYAKLIAFCLKDLHSSENISIQSICSSCKTMDISVNLKNKGSDIMSLYSIQFILRVDDDPCRPVVSFDFSGLKAYLRLKDLNFYGCPEVSRYNCSTLSPLIKHRHPLQFILFLQTGVNIITHRFLWARIHKYGWRGWRFYLLTHLDANQKNLLALLQSKELRPGQSNGSSSGYTADYFKHRSFTAQSILRGEGRLTSEMGRVMEATLAMHISINSRTPSKFHSFDLES